MLGALHLSEVPVRILGLSLVLRKLISNPYLLRLKELVVSVMHLNLLLLKSSQIKVMGSKPNQSFAFGVLAKDMLLQSVRQLSSVRSVKAQNM